MGIDAQQMLTTYRMDMNTIMYILQQIEGDLTPLIHIGCAVPPLLKLMAVLQFCATGSYQHTTGLVHGLSQPVFSRILTQVMQALLQRARQHIYLSRDPQAVANCKAAFYAIANFPNVIGCVDCTHIAHNLGPESRHIGTVA